MKISFAKTFGRDLKKLRDPKVLGRVQLAIEQVESAIRPADLDDFKKISGTDDCYRIRIGNYRIGLVMKDDTIEFARCMLRRDLYRYFP